MVVIQTLNFISGFFQFVGYFIEAIHEYVTDGELLDRYQLKGQNMVKPLPEVLPSLIEIKRAIPSICFRPNVLTSMYYAVRDVISIMMTFLIFYYVSTLTEYFCVRAILMVAYWAIQGTLFTGVFVIGHDCGHGSFSNYPILNNTVGTVMHSFLLAPYYMWKITHNIHHKHTGNLEADEVFYPIRESEPSSKDKVIPGFGLGIGWFGYLLKGYNPRAICHFQPFQPIFVKNMVGCIASLVALGVMSYFLYMFYLVFGFWALFNYYVVPDFIFASFCVVITFLHHTELNIPWFSDDQWELVKGSLSSVDRHYGPAHLLLHSIGTHQVHHLFTKIPHYHLDLATRHFREAFPNLVKVCDEPIIRSFFRMFRIYVSKNIVPDDAKIYYYD